MMKAGFNRKGVQVVPFTGLEELDSEKMVSASQKIEKLIGQLNGNAAEDIGGFEHFQNNSDSSGKSEFPPGLHLKIPETEVGAVEILTEYAYSRLDEIRNDVEALTAFEQLIDKVLRENDSDQDLLRILKSYGWNGRTLNSVDKLSIDIDALLKALYNLYLSRRKLVKASSRIRSTESEVENLIAFVPNLLIEHFQSISLVKPLRNSDISVSTSSMIGAVMLADISGFSKFAAEMCSQGVRGLNDLHVATNEFLGHIIESIYSYGGDGTFSCSRGFSLASFSFYVLSSSLSLYNVNGIPVSETF